MTIKTKRSDGEMNLLEHYIKEIHNVQDISDKFARETRTQT